ncbi:putative formate/nitrite transporter [Phlegmacium glaucopus]|nr:putative formate/nitrite transporter [Phlegmacium glaucopus]
MANDPPSTLKPAEVAHVLVQHAIAKHRDRYESVFFKAFMAGAMLSFGGLLSEVLQGGATGLTQSNPSIVKIFTVVFSRIVLQGQELLTSNMMTFPMAVARRAVPWWSLPVNWFIVLFGNLAGSLFFAAVLVHYTGIVSTQPYIAFIQEFAIKKAGQPQWHQIFLRGIGCNWLVSIAIWQAAGARDTISKIFAIWIPIWIFVACGYDHVVANMFSVPLGIMFGADLTVAQYIQKSFFAAFFGNIVGALFVALPALYFYRENGASRFSDAENGEIEPHLHASSSSNTSAEGKQR